MGTVGADGESVRDVARAERVLAGAELDGLLAYLDRHGPVEDVEPFVLAVVETDELAATLDSAAARWPEVRSRRELLLRLVEQGREVLDRERSEAIARRRDAVRRTGGALTGAYEPGYLERLRDDWPQ